ncbi:family 10 glycosylhydrolase [bacterium]|nr:family 10 glycosylhydrolase [bacterium]
MKMRHQLGLTAAFAALLALGCATGTSVKRSEVNKTAAKAVATAQKKAEVALDPVAASLPEVPREFRAAWVATVANIDWPSSRDLTTEEQQKELIAILDKAAELNLNALIFQVRPTADAFYQSDIEPWSAYLTGESGKAPSPFYDPLEMWVAEAHKRGIELHVWFNPYRAWHTSDKGPVSDMHIVKKNPKIVKKLANGMWWMDPAEAETQKQSLDVVLDVTRRYDVDGIHFDDYFYPYTSYNDEKDFPDDDSWAAYQAAGGTLSRGDWRRAAVDKFVKDVHDGVHGIKNHVKVGMSPFGIWRPGYPPTIKGMDQYDKLYADAKLWLNEGWVDYWTPQLYWPIKQEPQSFPVLLAWWVGENTKGVNVWPGMGTYRAGEAKWGDKTEVLNQIQITRALVPEGPGQVHFSFKTLQTDKDGVATALKEGPYRQKALVPASPWLDSVPPASPNGLSVTGNTLSWFAGPGESAFLYVVYRREGGAWQYDIIPGNQTSYTLPASADKVSTTDNIQGGSSTSVTKGSKADYVAVSAVDRVGNESIRVTLSVK